jgi:TrmH family RNA methyltransferase
MITKSELKRLISYKQSKYRDADNVFIVEGIKMYEELLDSNFVIESVYSTVQNICKQKNINIKAITEDELNRISLLTTPNKVYCLVKKLAIHNVFTLTQDKLTIVLDGIKDPGNLGTIIRIADWFGINDIVCSNDSVDVFNFKVVQATMGSIFRVNVHYLDLNHWLKSLPKDTNIYGTLLERGENLYSTHLISKGVIIVGNESLGIREDIKKFINCPLTIPRFSIKKNKPESLNVSVATAIILSEFCKK